METSRGTAVLDLRRGVEGVYIFERVTSGLGTEGYDVEGVTFRGCCRFRFQGVA